MKCVLLLLLTKHSVSDIVVPDWNYSPANNQELCVSVGDDTRWAFLALPEGTPPSGDKWPLYLHFVIDLFGPHIDKNATCGEKPIRSFKPFAAFATPNETLHTW